MWREISLAFPIEDTLSDGDTPFILSREPFFFLGSLYSDAGCCTRARGLLVGDDLVSKRGGSGDGVELINF